MNEKINLAKYRLVDSKEKLDSARILFDSKKFKDSVSRSYYAMFTAARALLATRGLDSVKHSGVVTLFNQHFVKEGIVGKICGRNLAGAKDSREESDYGDFVIVSSEDAESQLERAGNFVKEITEIIERNNA